MIHVLLPTFNRPDWLHESIESVLGQDLPEGQKLGLHILDNGGFGEAGAHSQAILDQYCEHPQVHLYRLLRNGQDQYGQPMNPWAWLQKQIWHEPEDLVHIWADDDLMLPGCLSRKEALFRGDSSLRLVYSQAERIGDSEGLLGSWWGPSNKLSGALDFHDLFLTNYIPWTSVMMAADLGLGVLGHEMSPVDDWVFLQRMSLETDHTAYLSEPTVQVRIHGQSGTRTSDLAAAHEKVWKHWLQIGHQPDAEVWTNMEQILAGHYLSAGRTFSKAILLANQKIQALRSNFPSLVQP